MLEGLTVSNVACTESSAKCEGSGWGSEGETLCLARCLGEATIVVEESGDCSCCRISFDTTDGGSSGRSRSNSAGEDNGLSGGGCCLYVELAGLISELACSVLKVE